MDLEELNKLVDEYLLMVQSLGDVESEETVAWQRRKMDLFLEFIKKRQIAEPLATTAFRQYAVYLKTRPRQDRKGGPLSPYYRRGCLQALKRFGNWLYLEGHADRNLGDAVSLTRLPTSRLPKAITPSDMDAMIASCHGFDDVSIRDQALLVTLRDTGCRASEMVGLCWCDVDLVQGRLFVTGKRGKQRWVFISVDAIILLTAYKDIVPDGDDDPVWWGHLGRKDLLPLSYRGLYQLLKRVAARAGVKGQWNPHSWRHAFGRDMSKAGVPTVVLSQMMGHSRASVTEIYTTMNVDDLDKIYRSMSPYAYQQIEEVTYAAV